MATLLLPGKISKAFSYRNADKSYSRSAAKKSPFLFDWYANKSNRFAPDNNDRSILEEIGSMERMSEEKKRRKVNQPSKPSKVKKNYK